MGAAGSPGPARSGPRVIDANPARQLRPKGLGPLIVGHEVEHALSRSWGHLANGRLLDACEEAGFDVLLTVDKGIRFQQNLRGRNLILVTLLTKQIRPQVLESFLPSIQEALATGPAPGTSIVIESPAK